MARHGTRTRYNPGCRCDDCVAANSSYQANYRQSRAPSAPVAVVPSPSGPGPVEAAVEAEIAELSESWPSLAQVALAMARILDNPKAISTQPAAARQLVAILGTFSKWTQRRGKLAVVKSMTTGSPSP